MVHLKLKLLSSLLIVVTVVGCRVEDPKSGESIAENTTPTSFRTPLPSNTDIPYGPYTHQKMDVYPAEGTPSGIAVIFVHGGGWVGGDKNMAESQPVFQYLLNQGHVGFSINYTLSKYSDPSQGYSPSNPYPSCNSVDGRPFPDNVNDVKYAIGWANLPENKQLYNYDKVIVVGESAGGHLAALATVRSDAHPESIPSGYNIKPDAAITMMAPIDMYSFGLQGTDEQRAFQNKFFNANPIQCLFGKEYAKSSDVPWLLRMAATPLFFVDKNDPPIYSISGIGDPVALSEFNADKLEQVYANLGGKYENYVWNDRIEVEIPENNGSTVPYSIAMHHAESYKANAKALNRFIEEVKTNALLN